MTKTEKELLAENERLRWDVDFHLNTIGNLTTEKQQAADQIKRLRAQLKNAVWTDSEELKLVEANNLRLRAALLDITHSSCNGRCADIACRALEEEKK